MRFYWLCSLSSPRHSGGYHYGHQWSLPGVACPVCKLSGGTAANAYPSVDLSNLPAPEQRKYLARFEEDFEEFARLREQVRSLVPPGVPLWPGTAFGPLEGSAWGEFGSLNLIHAWELVMKRDPFERLQAEGLRGLKGCRTALRFRKKNPPELLEMELLPRGEFHPDCLPERPVPCPKCERRELKRPDEPILDAASLPEGQDVFRLAGFLSMIIATERFVEAVRRQGYEQDIAFREIPVRGA
jgi:uncharacterized double-CXXCG motif protein